MIKYLLAALLLASPALAQSGNLSGGTVKATSSAASPSTLTNIISRSANVIDYGADPTGVASSTSAINAAAGKISPWSQAYKTVDVPAGKYYLTGKISIEKGAIRGAGRVNTQFYVDEDFNTSDACVICLSSGGFDPGPELSDFSITMEQPNTDTTTTTTVGTTAGNNTITVASVANILVGGSVTNATAAASIPDFSTVVSVVGNVVTLSANVEAPGVGNGDTIDFGPARGTFAALGSCTSGAGGTGCQYPPAISALSASSRYKVRDVRISGAWDGISSDGVNAVWWLDNIEMSALNVGLAINGTRDFTHIKGFHFWNFDIPTTSNLYTEVYGDGGTYAAQFGEVDGLSAVDFASWRGRVTINDASFWGQFSNLLMDGDNATLEIADNAWLQISNLYSTGTATGSNTACQIDISGGTNIITNSRYSSDATSICVSGGKNQFAAPAVIAGASGGTAQVRLTAGDTTFSNAYFSGLINQTGGGTLITGSQSAPVSTSTAVATISGGIFLFKAGRITPNVSAGTWTVPLFTVTGSGPIVSIEDNQFSSAPGGGDAGVISMTDYAVRRIVGNVFNDWTYSTPGPLGTYYPNSKPLLARVTAAPSAPTGTTSTAGVMMGLATAFTPVVTGKALITITGNMANDTVAYGASARMRYGTGTAPANGDAATGTGAGSDVSFLAAAAAQRVPFAISEYVSGLTIGTAYWFDLRLSAITGGTASLTNITVTVTEQAP